MASTLGRSIFAKAGVGMCFRRFADNPMENAHLMVAARYIENNPVAAGVVAEAEDWPWSSARAHIAGARTADDALTDVAALGRHMPNWRAMLAIGLEAIDETANIAEIEANTRTGRPLASPEWVAEAECAINRRLAPPSAGQSQRDGENSE